MKINNVNFTGAPQGVRKASTVVALAAASMLPMACGDASKVVNSEPVRDTVATVIKDTVRKNIDSTKDFFANIYLYGSGGFNVLNFSSKKQDMTLGVFTTAKSIAASALEEPAASTEKYFFNHVSSNVLENFAAEFKAGNVKMTDTTSNDTRRFFGLVLDKNLYGKVNHSGNVEDMCLKFTKMTDSAWVELNKKNAGTDNLAIPVTTRDSYTIDFIERVGKGSQEERIIMTKCVE